MLEKYKAKPGDEGYLDETGRKRYLIYIAIISILLIGYIIYSVVV